MDVKIACAQIQIEPGNPEANTRKALQAIAKARAAQVDILLLPELMVPAISWATCGNRVPFSRTAKPGAGRLSPPVKACA